MENNKNLFYKYVFLNIISMLGVSAYILVDTIFISKGMGEDGLTALNLVIPIFNVLSSFQFMLAIGGSTTYAIVRARGNVIKSNSIFTHVILFAFFLGSLCTLGGVLFSDKITYLLGARDHIMELAQPYLKIILSFSLLFIYNTIFIVFMRNDYKPKVAMLAGLLGNLLNIIFDYILIIKLEMGMVGAALATVSSPILGLLIMSPYILTGNTGFKLIKCKFSLRLLVTSLFPGLSVFINDMTSAVKIAVFNYLFLKLLGNIGVASYGIIANFTVLFFACFYGVGEGVQPLISTSYGKNKYEEVIHFIKKGYMVSMGIGVLFFILTNTYLNQLIALFNWNNNPELFNLTKVGLQIFLISLLFAGQSICGMLFQAAMGKSVNALVLSLLRGFIFTVPLAYIMGEYFGYKGVYWSIVISELLTFLVNLYIYQRSKRNLQYYKNLKETIS